MTPEEYKPGLRVWYEPSFGIRFLGETVDEAPRKIGDTWVTTVTFRNAAYGTWRLFGRPGMLRMSVPAAALESLHVDPLPAAKER